MGQRKVIARAFLGEPLLRVVVSIKGTLVYIANPQVLDKSESDARGGVGFPLEDVFLYDEPLFAALKSAWRKHGETPNSLWEKLSRYKDEAAN